MYLLNAFSLNMVSSPSGIIEYEEIDSNEASDMLSQCAVVNAIGHAETDSVVRNELHAAGCATLQTGERMTVTLKPGCRAIVAQYIGQRLAEGATTLPEGAKIKFFWVKVTGNRA